MFILPTTATELDTNRQKHLNRTDLRLKPTRGFQEQDGSMNLPGRVFALTTALLGHAGALSIGLPTTEGGWIGWQCARQPGLPLCELKRLTPQGRVMATAASSEAGTRSGSLALRRSTPSEPSSMPGTHTP